MIELTEEQHQAVEESGSEPVRAIDRITSAEYVLLRAEVYERIRSLAHDDWSEDSYAAAMEVFARDGWDDPRMAVYDSYDSRRQE